MSENPREPKLDEEYRPAAKLEGFIEYDDSEKYTREIDIRLQEIASRMKIITENLPTLKNNIKVLEAPTQSNPSNTQLLVLARTELASAEEEFAKLLEESRKLKVSIECLEDIKRRRAILLDKFPKDNPQ